MNSKKIYFWYICIEIYSNGDSSEARKFQVYLHLSKCPRVGGFWPRRYCLNIWVVWVWVWSFLSTYTYIFWVWLGYPPWTPSFWPRTESCFEDASTKERERCIVRISHFWSTARPLLFTFLQFHPRLVRMSTCYNAPPPFMFVTEYWSCWI